MHACCGAKYIESVPDFNTHNKCLCVEITKQWYDNENPKENNILPFNIMDAQVERKIVWILISWILQKPADLDLHCFLNQIYRGWTGQI